MQGYRRYTHGHVDVACGLGSCLRPYDQCRALRPQAVSKPYFAQAIKLKCENWTKRMTCLIRIWVRLNLLLHSGVRRVQVLITQSPCSTTSDSDAYTEPAREKMLVFVVCGRAPYRTLCAETNTNGIEQRKENQPRKTRIILEPTGAACYGMQL